MDKKELKSSIRYIEDMCRRILKESKKWRVKYPEALFTHGYAHEKATKLLDELNTTLERLK